MSELERAERFLADLEEDRHSAPPEVEPVIECYAPRLRESIRLFREGTLTARVLEAHVFQIRLTYVRDLNRLLMPEAPEPGPRWVRSA